MKEIKSQDSEIGKIWQVIESAEDSKIPFIKIEKYPHEWQAHREQISDYLILGEGAWWFKDNPKNVVYYASKKECQLLQSLNHFIFAQHQLLP